MAPQSTRKRSGKSKGTLTEVDWQTRGSPSLLLRLMRAHGASERKLLLIFHAFWQRYRDRDQLGELEQQVIALMEQMAENASDQAELQQAIAEAEKRAQTLVDHLHDAAAVRLGIIASFARLRFPLPGIHPVLDLDVASAVIRDVYHPFAPSKTAFTKFSNSSLLRSLAEPIYQERAFDRLPILGDAMEEAGCTNTDVLAHCRGPGPHVRGCWVVDLLLEME